jgi:hypothetical protein
LQALHDSQGRRLVTHDAEFKLREAHDRLASCYARLTEGQGRGPAREAKAALDELAARLDAGTPGSVR